MDEAQAAKVRAEAVERSAAEADPEMGQQVQAFVELAGQSRPARRSPTSWPRTCGRGRPVQVPRRFAFVRAPGSATGKLAKHRLIHQQPGQTGLRVEFTVRGSPAADESARTPAR